MGNTITQADVTDCCKTVEGAAGLEHEGIKVLRSYCRAQGYAPVTLLREEEARITTQALDFEGYRKVKRTGSRYAITRNVRRAVYAIVAARKVLKAHGYC